MATNKLSPSQSTMLMALELYSLLGLVIINNNNNNNLIVSILSDEEVVLRISMLAKRPLYNSHWNQLATGRTAVRLGSGED